MKKIAFSVVLSMILISCASQPQSYQLYLQKRKVSVPSPERIDQCHGYGCRIISPVSLAEDEWKKIAALLKPASKTAQQERERIVQAIGLFERIVGPRTGTAGDVRGTFRKTGDNQLDCVDESTNTTSYLAALQSGGLIKFHSVEAPTVRLPLIHAGHWPHQTAVIRDEETGIAYAVDSWFQDNGAPADIIDLKTWKEGWKPESVRDFL